MAGRSHRTTPFQIPIAWSLRLSCLWLAPVWMRRVAQVPSSPTYQSHQHHHQENLSRTSSHYSNFSHPSTTINRKDYIERPSSGGFLIKNESLWLASRLYKFFRELQTTFTPADFEALAQTDLSETTCVVFDILRATSNMVTALANRAERIRPVATIEEALEQQAAHPDALLCGERRNRRITAEQTGGSDFVLGNSPREYTADQVAGKTLITTTTNGTRALRACLGAANPLVGSFLNLQATIDHLQHTRPGRLVLVCGGTFEEAAFEDTLAAGAIADGLGSSLRLSPSRIPPRSRVPCGRRMAIL